MLRKIIITIISVLVLGSFSSASVFAETVDLGSEELVSGALLDDPTLTPDVERKLRKETEEKDRLAKQLYDRSLKQGKDGDLDTVFNTSSLLEISVPNFKQEQSYWCGPASARQSLSFHKTKSGSSTALPPQSTLATKIGTTSSGSLTTGIVSALNSYSGTFGNFTYTASDIENETYPLDKFIVRIRASMTQTWTTAPIVLLQTSYLPRYQGKSSRHYATISGHNSTSPQKMRTVDPNISSLYYGIYWDPVGSTSANGVFRAVYEADKAGTNKAMAW